MSVAETIQSLNHLLALQCRSLPMYLVDASPWVPTSEEKAAAALSNIVADQQAMAARIAAEVLQRGGALDTGEFPMEFTDLHFLGFEFLVGELIRHQKQDIASIEGIVEDLRNDRRARDLAEEALGAERAHLEALEELAGTPNAA